MMAVNLGDPVERVRLCVDEGRLTFPIALETDPHALWYDGSALTRQYGALVTPTLCLLDSRGRIVWHAAEFRLRQLPELRAALSRLGVT
jgi:hypothetical protein